METHNYLAFVRQCAAQRRQSTALSKEQIAVLDEIAWYLGGKFAARRYSGIVTVEAIEELDAALDERSRGPFVVRDSEPCVLWLEESQPPDRQALAAAEFAIEVHHDDSGYLFKSRNHAGPVLLTPNQVLRYKEVPSMLRYLATYDVATSDEDRGVIDVTIAANALRAVAADETAPNAERLRAAELLLGADS